MSMILLNIAPPETGGGIIRGQRRHCRKSATCRSSDCCWRDARGIGSKITRSGGCALPFRAETSRKQMAVQFRDYYETLGVPKTASDAEIKKAFRKLARQHHPDVAKDKKAAEEKFKEINEAYEVLGDPAKRKKYDELGPNWSAGSEFRPPPGWESYSSTGGFPGRGPKGE